VTAQGFEWSGLSLGVLSHVVIPVNWGATPPLGEALEYPEAAYCSQSDNDPLLR